MTQKSNKFLYICYLDFVFLNIGYYLLTKQLILKVFPEKKSGQAMRSLR